MNRYSPGHNIVHLGSYLTPILPLALLSALYPYPYYTATWVDLTLLWILGLIISYLLIAVHEAGHAIVARLLGIGVREITVGHWRRLTTLTLQGVPIILRAAPASGYVKFDPVSLQRSSLRKTAVLLAGTVAELICVAGAAQTTAVSDISSPTDLVVAFVRLAVLWIGGIQAVYNLVPVSAWVAGEQMPTDGLQILTLWRRKNQLPHNRATMEQLERLSQLVAARDFPAALKLADEIALSLPNNVELASYTGTLHAESGASDKAESIWRELLNQQLSSKQRAAVLDQLCCLPLYYGRMDLLREADAWSLEALRLAPGAITLEGTRGSILVELGESEKALPMLRKVVRRSECSTDLLIGSAFIAKASALMGDPAEAQTWLKKAKAIDARHRVVLRIEEELKTLVGQASGRERHKGAGFNY